MARDGIGGIMRPIPSSPCGQCRRPFAGLESRMNAGRLIVMALFSFYIVVLALLTPKRQPPREPSRRP
jgi:hypothetical protein